MTQTPLLTFNFRICWQSGLWLWTSLRRGDNTWTLLSWLCTETGYCRSAAVCFLWVRIVFLQSPLPLIRVYGKTTLQLNEPHISQRKVKYSKGRNAWYYVLYICPLWEVLVFHFYSMINSKTVEYNAVISIILFHVHPPSYFDWAVIRSGGIQVSLTENDH